MARWCLTPMSTHAIVRISGSNEPRVLLPGDILGRGPSAAVELTDPRVHQAHALVSLRSELVLLRARGWLHHDGERTEMLALRPGRRIGLTADHSIEVEVLAVEVDRDTTRVVVGDGAPEIVRREQFWRVEGTGVRACTAEEADLWWDERSWIVRQDDTCQPLEVGTPVRIRGTDVTLLRPDGAIATTRPGADEPAPGMTLVPRRGCVVIAETGARIEGQPGRLLAWLLEAPRGPVELKNLPFEELGFDGWRAAQNLPQRLHTLVYQCRRELKRNRVLSTRLISGAGRAELVVSPPDTVRPEKT